MAQKIFTKQFKEMLPTLFKSKAYFTRSFGSLEVLDGIRNNEKAFSVKTSDMEAILNDYDTTKKIDAGRLGEMQEIVSVDVDVDYEATKSINEGIDVVTVNDDVDQIAAERMEKQSKKIALDIDAHLGKKISDNAGKTITGDLTEAGVTGAFNDARKWFKNNELDDDVVLRQVMFTTI